MWPARLCQVAHNAGYATQNGSGGNREVRTPVSPQPERQNLILPGNFFNIMALQGFVWVGGDLA